MRLLSLTLITVAVLPSMAQELPKESIEITTIRGVLGKVEPLEHTTGQLRVGYIDLNMKGSDTDLDSHAFAVGGHIHLDSKRWRGIMIGVEGYFVEDLGLRNDNPNNINDDFFDADKEGFATLSQAFIDGKWGNTEIKIGRQMIDTPHADSDDIRMMPNYFMAYLLTNTDCEGLTLTLGQIDRMAGWENGVDAKKFVPVEKTLGSDEKTNGIYLASAVYEGFENLTIQAWYYDIDDIADLLYLEVGYKLSTAWADLTVGIQYDTAKKRGKALLGDIDSQTWGVSVEAAFANGLTLLAAYNADHGDTGAFVSLGGGPFFTSLEDQTLDAVGQKGKAWIAGAGYDFAQLGLEGLNMGVVYGRFAADKKEAYETTEIDIAARFAAGHFNLTTAYALIDDRTAADRDKGQFRLIVEYGFSR